MVTTLKSEKSVSEDAQTVSLSLDKLATILRSNRLHLFYTALIFFNHFAYGITVSIIGATLVDLGFIYGVSLDTISYLPIAVSTGYLLGALFGLFSIYRYLNRQLMIILFISLLALTIAFVPYYTSLPLALVALLLNGIGDGGYDAASAVWIIEMWPTGNSIFLQASQFMYGLGTILAPILVAPFVHGKELLDGDNRTLTVERRRDGLALPFQINGAIQVLAPVVLLGLYCFRPYRSTADLPKSPSATADLLESGKACKTASCKVKGEASHRTGKLILIAICLSTYAAAEFAYFSFSTAMFQYFEPHPLSAADSALVMSILSTTFTLGRLLTALISIKLSPDTIISYHYLTLLASLALLYFGRAHLGLLYLGTALLGYGFSAMWPAMFAFTEAHLGLTDRVSSCFSFLFGLTSLCLSAVMGQLFEEYPTILFLIEVIAITISLALFITVRIWIAKSPKRLIDK